MPHGLEVPYTLASFGLERKQAIGEQVVADAVTAVKIEGRGASRNVDHAGLGIQRHACPVVGGATVFPRVFWPSLVTVFTSMGNRVENPAKLPGANVKGTDVAGCGREGLVLTSADNEKIF